MPSAFTLQNLYLGYGGKAVLHIDRLEVPEGQMVFVIGPSGVGKSSLLETIGLMSDTFISTGTCEPVLWIGDDRFDPHTLWHTERHRLSEIRRQRFSFIFQSTNLMPNFSIGENIRMAFQGDASKQDELDQRIGHLLTEMNLPPEVLNKEAHAVSGGQRQRIAFIRAMVKDFQVLLADEPTGNLDHENSLAVFRVLKEHLRAHGRTAIIVTHHVDLAREFGDMVLEIRPGSDGEPATVGISETVGSA